MGYIGYTWALHFSWIVVMFGGTHLHLENFAELTEAERFNLYLGSTFFLKQYCCAGQAQQPGPQPGQDKCLLGQEHQQPPREG